jgi:1,2-diacylglycerol 3-alpha-glucosyltransferase
MKILITTDTFYPMINGVVISTDNLYKELKKQGHDVRVLTLSHTKKDRVEDDIYYLKAFKVKVYPDARVKHLIIGDIEKSMIEWKPDVVHTQTEFSTLIAARYIIKKTGALHVHTYHTMYEEYVKYLFKGKLIRPKMVGRLTHLVFYKMDGIVVPTEKMRELLIKCKTEKPLFVVPTGLDIEKFQKRISEEEKIDLLKKYHIEDKKLLIYVGRIGQEKNIEEVIEYFSRMDYMKNNLKLMIVGGGPYLSNLRDLVDRLNINDNVVFTGMIPPQEVHKYYQLGHIFVTASTSETQGLTYIEALASGVPVICRRDPCIDGLIIDGYNGYTFEHEEEFSTSVLKLINNENHRIEAIKGAELKAQEYSREIFGKKIISIYEELKLHEKKTKSHTQLEKVNKVLNKIF